VPDLDLLVVADRVLTPDGEVAAAVGVAGGRIRCVLPAGDLPPAARVVRLAADEVLMPGVVDTHVHLQDPGRPEWEDAASATRAAALGGVTTLVDMPLDSDPVTVDLASLAAKRAALAGRCVVDVGLWGGAVPGNAGRRGELLDAGVLGLKAFLSPSGLEDFPPLSADELAAALAELRTRDAVLLVHAEDEGHARPLRAPAPRYAQLLDSRPAEVEAAAVATVVEAARRTGGRAHVVHVSSAASLPLLAKARREQVRVTAETCPHYLAHAAEEVPDGATALKAMPPVRAAADRRALWDALAAGVLDAVVSDHSPGPPGEPGDFALAPPGVSSLQVSLSVVWTEARARGVPLHDVVRWMCRQPAELAGLRRKGRIEAGADADLVVLAPEQEHVVDGRALAHRQPGTPYDGRRLRGVVRRTWLRGADLDDGPARGRLLRRGTN